ncbi:hypothetical protein O181_118425 [Austropuccinia psidii MF-1]|uniref:Uncharacterized protein n=1 Tax=Austropuccinia psidii MF-1 TaxID=1389203 RepID=A0A9Q3KGD0_9BASI|nr:hypothetical protein [Austropuccinia psidii MF-1]
MLACLPHLKGREEKLSLHLRMAETCMELFEKRQLAAVASVEPCCSTRMTAEGRTPKAIVEHMVPLLDYRILSFVHSTVTNLLEILMLCTLVARLTGSELWVHMSFIDMGSQTKIRDDSIHTPNWPYMKWMLSTITFTME